MARTTSKHTHNYYSLASILAYSKEDSLIYWTIFITVIIKYFIFPIPIFGSESTF